MYCPKCTLEIKGEDQETCPICSEPLIDSPVEKDEEPTSEDLKLQELIADIDSTVSGSADQSSSEETLDGEAELSGENEPDFKLDMDDKPTEPESETLEPGEDFSLDLEKEFSLEDEMTDGELSQEQLEEEVYDLEKELGLVDEEIKAADEEPPSIDFDKLALTEEEKSFALDDAVEEDDSDDAAGTDTKEDINKTLEELDPIKDVEQPKKSSSLGLVAFLIILVVICGIVYMKFKPEIEGLLNPESEIIVKDEQLKEKFGPKADKPVDVTGEKAVENPSIENSEVTDVKEAAESVVEKPAEKKEAVEASKPVVEKVTEKNEAVIPPKPSIEKAEVKEVKESAEPAVEKAAEKKKAVEPPKTAVEKVEVKDVKEPAKPVEKESAVPVKPSITYSIHAGSFRKTQLAQRDVDRFNKLGFNAYIQRVNLGDKGVWYRVKVGLYNTRAEAIKAEKELRDKAKAQTRIVRNK